MTEAVQPVETLIDRCLDFDSDSEPMNHLSIVPNEMQIALGPFRPLSLSHSLLLSPSHIRVWSVNHMGAPIYLHTCPRPLYHMYIDIPAKCDYTIGNMANYSH